jgi:hypothetical protein
MLLVSGSVIRCREIDLATRFKKRRSENRVVSPGIGKLLGTEICRGFLQKQCAVPTLECHGASKAEWRSDRLNAELDCDAFRVVFDDAHVPWLKTHLSMLS